MLGLPFALLLLLQLVDIATSCDDDADDDVMLR